MHHQDELSKSEGNIAGYTVQLYRALGGGWDAAKAEETAGDSPAKAKTAADAVNLATLNVEDESLDAVETADENTEDAAEEKDLDKEKDNSEQKDENDK